MTKLLQKHGNSLALVFDKTMLELLNIDAETPLEITINSSGSLTVTPVHVGVPAEELQEHIARLRPRYKRMLENLSK